MGPERSTYLRGGSTLQLPPGAARFDGSTVGTSGAVHRLQRGMLEVDVSVPGLAPLLTVAVTHLDHISEAERAVQLRHVLDQLSPRAANAILLRNM